LGAVDVNVDTFLTSFVAAPWSSLFPAIIELPMFTVAPASLKIAPADTFGVGKGGFSFLLPEIVILLAVSVAPIKLRIPPPLRTAVLFPIVEFVIVNHKC
jgi:hypothetical protein